MPIFHVKLDVNGVVTGVAQAEKVLGSLEKRVDGLNSKFNRAFGGLGKLLNNLGLGPLDLVTKAISFLGDLVFNTAKPKIDVYSLSIETLGDRAEKAADSLKRMQNEIKHKSRFEAEVALAELQPQLEESRKQLKAWAGNLGLTKRDFGLSQQLSVLANQLADGTIKFKEFEEQAIAAFKAYDVYDAETAAKFNETVEKGRNFSQWLDTKSLLKNQIATGPEDSDPDLERQREKQAELYAVTEEGRRAKLEDAVAEASRRDEMDKSAESAAILKHALQQLADFDNLGKAKEGNGNIGPASVAETVLPAARPAPRPTAPSQPDRRAAAVSDIREEVARLNLSEQEYDQYRFDQKIAEYKRLKVPVEEIRALEEARAADLVRREEESAEDALQTRTEFWRDYSRLTGQGHAEYLIQSEESLRQRKEAYIQAGIDEVTAEKWVQEQLRDLRASEETPVQQGIGQARSNLAAGEGSFGDFTTASMGNVVEDYRNMAFGLSEVWGGFFSDFSTGFSNSIGQAIWESESLGDSLYNVVTGALSSLTSGNSCLMPKPWIGGVNLSNVYLIN